MHNAFPDAALAQADAALLEPHAAGREGDVVEGVPQHAMDPGRVLRGDHLDGSDVLVEVGVNGDRTAPRPTRAGEDRELVPVRLQVASHELERTVGRGTDRMRPRVAARQTHEPALERIAGDRVTDYTPHRDGEARTVLRPLHRAPRRLARIRH